MALSSTMVSNQEELVARITDARRALDIAASTIKEVWPKCRDESDAALKDLRMLRMALDGEVGLILRQLKDVRQFFLGADHEVEMVRLKDFVDTAERLQALHKSGFLDNVADVMLKLAEAK